MTARRLRHGLAKVLTPKTFESLAILRSREQKIASWIGRVPRPATRYAKRFLGRQLIALEIGVGTGVNAESILTELSIKRLFLVDPYTPYIDSTFGLADHGNEREEARRRLSSFHQCRWIEKTSEDAKADLANEAFDFVYVDGNHSFQFVLDDIWTYYPLVRSGGVIGGHDYIPYFDDVVWAVDLFANAMGLELYSCFPDWWLVKPSD